MRTIRSTGTGLDPTGRMRLRRGQVLRAVAAAVLLVAAAGVYWQGAVASTPPPDRAARSTSTPAGPAPASPTPDADATTGPALPGSTSPGFTSPGPTAGSRATGPSRLPIPDGMVGVPVPLGTPTAAGVLRPGDRVRLLAVTGTEAPLVVAEEATVLAVDRPGPAVFLALAPDQAREVVSTPASTRFAVIVRHAR